MVYLIKNDKTEIIINSLGAEVRSVVHNKKERAWQNATGEWSGCAILLFPFAGFNHLIYDDVDFGVQKHGFCRNEEFEFVSKTDSIIEFKLLPNDRTKKVYPYEFEFYVRYTLIDDGYEVKYIIKNPTNGEIPISCGGHESFALDEDVDRYYIEFEKNENIDFQILNAHGFLTREVENHGEGRVLALEKSFTDNSATVALANINSRKVLLKSKNDDKLIVKIGFEGFDNLLLWHPHGAKMLCIEPWQCLPSYEGEIKEFKERKGVIILSPFGEIEFTRTITY